jgi:uracil-DNA glycosylase family 4
MMTKQQKGFFLKPKQTDKPGPIKRTASKRTPATIQNPCQICGLDKTCITPRMEPHGNGKKQILIIAEAPGKTEDSRGEQLVGEAGNLLRDYMAEAGLDLHEDCWKINAVNCRPPGNKTPSKKQIKCCKWMVEQAIQDFHPKFIFLMGNIAVDSFYGGMFSDNTAGRWRKLCIPDRNTNAWVIALYHPSFILRSANDRNLESLYKKDLKFAASCVETGQRPTFRDFEKCLKIYKEFDPLADFLEELMRERQITISIDYETTGLKPYEQGHRILTCAIAPHEGLSAAFPVSYPWWESDQEAYIKEMLAAIMANPKIKKVCHNAKFEDIWSREILGIPETKGMEWCTMIGAHIIDCRKYFCGLDFQAYINFGVYPYHKEIEPYMKTRIPGTPFNRLTEYDLDKLLQYNAMDPAVTYPLYLKQRSILTRKRDSRSRAFSFFMKGDRALTDSTHEGICADELYYLEQRHSLDRKITEMDKEITTSKEAKKFKEVTGKPFEPANKDFSAQDLRTMFFEVLKLKPGKQTASGLDAIDKEVLGDLNHPFSQKIIMRRRAWKLRHTYLAQFEREIYNGKIHPFFDLHTARTYRSSSSLPNFQNIPNRDEEAKKVTRQGIKPTRGNQILTADYGSIEVRVAACYTKDPVLIDYINDPSTDMHRDEAMQIFALDLQTVTKMLRFYAKNQFVFPEFYGSYFKSCAKNLWDTCIDLETGQGITVHEHLRKVMFGNCTKKQEYQIFENHVKKVEEKFWDKFHVFREWQQQMIFDYQKKGYVEMFFGHWRNDRMTNNRILNTAIQGTAFHLLLESYIELNNIRKERQWATKLIGQIHDEILQDVNPQEREEVTQTTEQVMTQKEHDWLIVPLAVEMEITPIDTSWHAKMDLHKYLEEYKHDFEPRQKIPADKPAGVSRERKLKRKLTKHY